MKKYLIGGVLVVAFVSYVIFANENSASSTVVAPSTPDSSTTTPSSSQGTASTTIYAFTPSLSIGSVGPQVKALQQLLIDRGDLTGVAAPTGYFGVMTKAALAKFQTENGGALPTLGYVGSGAISIVDGGNTTGSTPAGSTGIYTDGTYTGSVADAFYGSLQATVVIQGGKIVDVQFPQYPQGGHSGQVSASALPVLKQEAIASQSAKVDTVSGATQDSEAFQQTLASALAQAKS